MELNNQKENFFKKSIDLFNEVSNIETGIDNIHKKLKVQNDISFWDVLSTYLILYRFPRLLNKRQSTTYKILINYFRLKKNNFLISYYNFKNIFKSSKYSTLIKIDNRKKTILLVVKNAHFNELLKPITIQLRRLNLNVLVFFLDDFEHYEENYCSLNRILNKDDFDKINKLNTQFLNINLNNLMKKLHTNKKLIKSEFKNVLSIDSRKLLPYYVCAKKILSQISPEMIISTDDVDQRVRVFNLIGMKLKINCLTIQQGLTSPGYPEWIKFSGNQISAMGEMSKDIMIKQGINKEKIFINGHPNIKFDRKNFKFKSVRNKKTNLNILYTCQPFVDGAFISQELKDINENRIFQCLNSLCNKISVTIKPHPAVSKKAMKKITKNFLNLKVCNRSDDTYKLINECDILITLTSTTAINALALNKQVLIVDLNGCINNFHNIFFKNQSIFHLKKENNLVETINKIKDNSIPVEEEKVMINAKEDFLSRVCSAGGEIAIKNITNHVISNIN